MNKTYNNESIKSDLTIDFKVESLYSAFNSITNLS